MSQPSTQIAHAPAPAARTAVNRLIAAMPPDMQQRLHTIATRVPLDKSSVLVEVGAPQTHVFFPCSGLLSLQMMTQDGNSVEVAMVGRDGVTALPFTGTATAAYTTIVTVAGDALRMSASALQAECERNLALQRVLLQQWHRITTEIANGSACHRFHTARQRLARWLLTACDRIQSSHLELTQEQLAEILGLQRTGVTVASVALQDVGAIAARHGRIRIVDRARLQHAACECYGNGR